MWFFPSASAALHSQVESAALTVCAGCPVRRDCLAWAYGEAINEGIFGGLTARERQSQTLDELWERSERNAARRREVSTAVAPPAVSVVQDDKGG